MKEKIKLVLALIALTLFCVGIALFIGLFYRAVSEPGVLIPTVVSTNSESIPSDEYYRGAYDNCLYIYTASGGRDADAVRDCNALVDRMVESDWYSQPSKGYEP